MYDTTLSFVLSSHILYLFANIRGSRRPLAFLMSRVHCFFMILVSTFDLTTLPPSPRHPGSRTTYGVSEDVCHPDESSPLFQLMILVSTLTWLDHTTLPTSWEPYYTPTLIDCLPKVVIRYWSYWEIRILRFPAWPCDSQPSMGSRILIFTPESMLPQPPHFIFCAF